MPLSIFNRDGLTRRFFSYIHVCCFTDVDECRHAANPVCGSHASCKNTPGSFDCVCDPGFYSVNEKNCAGRLDMMPMFTIFFGLNNSTTAGM